MTAGPSLAEIACHVEAVGGIKLGASTGRLIQVQVSAAGGGGGGEVGEYDIVYSLPSEGRYRMWIRVHGRDVQDSPFQVTRATCLCGSTRGTAQVTCLPEEDSSRRTVRSYSASLPRPSSR